MSAVPQWSTACLDWRERIVKQGRPLTLAAAVKKGIRSRESLIAFKPLFPKNALEGLDTFDALVMTDAANQPTMGEVSLPWIREFVGHIFGSYDDETGIRHIREYFMLISKKNGKSTDAAAIMLTALILNWRHDADFIILSPTIKIAQNSFEPAAAMVRADPLLSELLHVQDHNRTITHRHTNAKLQVVAADSNTVGGTKAVGVLVDELWLFGKMPKAASMLREATGGLASRPEGFVIYMTTQSDEPPAGVFKEKLEYARKVRDGEIDDNRFLPVIYEFPEQMIKDELHLLPENFYVTNPNMHMSVDEAHILREYKKAQDTSESEVRDFLAKHLNVEIGLNLRADRWPGAEFWLSGEDSEPVSFDRLLKECEVITVGIDGGGLDDLLGFAAIGRTRKEHPIVIPAHKDEETGIWMPERTVMRKKWLLWTFAWAHPSVLARRKSIASVLEDFDKQGELKLVKMIGEDTDALAQIVLRIHEAGLLYQCGLDPACIGGILDAILLTGVPEDKMVTVNQGWRLAGAIKTTERKLAEKVLVHGGTKLMNWSVGNARVKVVGNAIVITKQVSGTAKIDPLLAAFNAVSLMALNPPAQTQLYNFNNMVIGG